MQMKMLRHGGLPVTTVGLGTGHLGLPLQSLAVAQYSTDPDWKNYMDHELGVRTVVAALDAGIRLIDTAPWYGRGAAETMVGEALKYRSDIVKEVVVATKIGHLYHDDGYDFSYDAAMRSFEGSQKRLDLTRFPIVYLHDPLEVEPRVVMNGAFRAMRRLQTEGLIGTIGIGVNDPRIASHYIATREFGIAMVVASWSLINQSATKFIIPWAEYCEVDLVAATAVERGLLATGYDPTLIYPERKVSEELSKRIWKIKKLCEKFGITLLAAALQWCTRHPSFVAAIPGARTPEQVKENAAAGEVAIPEEFWGELAPLLETWDYL